MRVKDLTPWPVYTILSLYACTVLRKNMADEKYLVFLLLKRSCFFSPEIRKPTFAHLLFQKNRRRRRYKLFIIYCINASLQFCRAKMLDIGPHRSMVLGNRNSIHLQGLVLYDNFPVSKATFEYIVSQIEDEIGHQDIPQCS